MCASRKHVSPGFAADIFDSVSCEGGTRGDIVSERKGKKEKKMSPQTILKKNKKTQTESGN